MGTSFGHSNDPKELLQQEWASRREKNPALSLRSFARFLKISPGRLSEILSGKRKLSLEMAERISDRLGLDPETKAKLISSILKRRKTSAKVAAEARKLDKVGPDYKQLTNDAFHVISDWYHFAILNLRDCDDFKPDESWIAKRLNIGLGEVRLAIARMERLGLIERREKSWVRTHAHLTTTHDVRSAGLRKGHRGIIDRAIDSLEKVEVADRDITNMTMAINPEKLPEAKAMLARFRKKFAKIMEQGNGRTEVYTVAIQLFPLTELRKEKKQ
jgi:uncharacterized protein (TIGR02147 family)